MQSHLFEGYWADVGTVDSFYQANIMLTRPGAPFKFYDPRRPIYTHPRFLPGSQLSDCSVRDVTLAEGCYLDHCTVQESIVGIRTTIRPGAVVRRSVLLGADFYEAEEDVDSGCPRLGIGRDVVLDRVIVDKNARIGDGARLINEGLLREFDGDGFFIRDRVIVVPKDGVIRPGTKV
jgi:glucose-1-phosphate adenylyltransferase